VRELLAHPAAQVAAAPLAAGFAVALLLYPLRASGLAVTAGFFAALYLAHRLDFHQRMVVVIAVAAVIGALIDLAFRPSRALGVLLGIVFGMAVFWVYLQVLGNKPPLELALHMAAIAGLAALGVACMTWSYDEPERAGAAGVALGAGLGIASWVFSWRLDLQALSLAAACGGFLLLVMMLGRGVVAGASFTLSASVIASLLAAGAVLAGRLPWYAAGALLLVPIAVRLPVPQRAPVVVQVLVALLYAHAAAAAVCTLAWFARRGG
jgi:hypothetical protein